MTHRLESDVLIVDDEIRLVHNLQTLLGWEGYQTRQASNGREAIALIQERPPSLIISDIMMPEMDGYQLLSYTQENFPHIPVIAVTGFGSIDSAIKAMQKGALDYILKPFDHGLIIETVARAAEQSRRNWYDNLHRELISVIGSTLSLDLVMGKVLDLSKRGTGAENGTLLILDEQGRVVQHVLAEKIELPQSRKRIIGQMMKEGLAGWLYQNQESVLINDTGQDKRWIDLPEYSYQAQSVIGIPFTNRQKVQGLMLLVHSETDQFDAADLQFLKSVALPVAMAIENTRLFERERQRSRDMTTLYDAGLAIASTLDEETTTQIILQQIALLTGVSNCAITYRNRGDKGVTTHLNLVLREGIWHTCHAQEDCYLVDGYPTLSEILLEREIVVKHVGDLDLDSVEQTWLESRHIQSLMHVPLLWHGYVKGLLILAHTDSGKQFTGHDKRLIAGLIPQVTTAMENARLFETIAMQTAWVEAQAHELEQERRKLTALLSSTSDVILAIDDQGIILLANPALDQVFEIDHEIILDRPYQAVLQNTPLLDMLDQARVENKPLSLEVESVTGRTYYANVTPVPDMGYMTVLRDISHLKDLDRMRVELLSTASHDLKNPLTVIQGYINLLDQMGELNDKQRSATQKIDRAVVGMAELIGDLLDLTRLESGLSLQLEMYPFNHLVENTIVNFEEQVKRKEIALTLDLDDTLNEVACDPRRLQQALTNLVSNAVKYTPIGGKVTVKTISISDVDEQTEQGSIQFSVQDSGYGIKTEYLAHIFDRFYRVETEQTEDIEGTGLGLAIVKTIVEQHGGRIWVESEEGKGSTFTFVL